MCIVERGHFSHDSCCCVCGACFDSSLEDKIEVDGLKDLNSTDLTETIINGIEYVHNREGCYHHECGIGRAAVNGFSQSNAPDDDSLPKAIDEARKFDVGVSFFSRCFDDRVGFVFSDHPYFICRFCVADTVYIADAESDRSCFSSFASKISGYFLGFISLVSLAFRNFVTLISGVMDVLRDLVLVLLTALFLAIFVASIAVLCFLSF